MTLDGERLDPTALTHWLAYPHYVTKQERDRVRLLAAYWRDPEAKRAQARAYYQKHRQAILERIQVKNITRARADVLRVRAADQYRKNRKAKCAKARAHHHDNRCRINAERRARRQATAILCAVLDWLDACRKIQTRF